MFLWIDGVPNEITNESVPNLVSYINSTIRSCLPDSEDEELNYLVKKLQTHSHTTYCTKSYKASCRFGFPKLICTQTKVLGNIDFNSVNKGKFYFTKRGKNETMIN